VCVCVRESYIGKPIGTRAIRGTYRMVSWYFLCCACQWAGDGDLGCRRLGCKALNCFDHRVLVGRLL